MLLARCRRARIHLRSLVLCSFPLLTQLLPESTPQVLSTSSCIIGLAHPQRNVICSSLLAAALPKQNLLFPKWHKFSCLSSVLLSKPSVQTVIHLNLDLMHGQLDGTTLPLCTNLFQLNSPSSKTTLYLPPHQNKPPITHRVPVVIKY